MIFYPSGFIPIIIYGSYGEGAIEDNAITTESGQDILTENNEELLLEEA